MSFYVFPNGRFVPRWSRWLVALLLVLVSIGQILDKSTWFIGIEIGWIAFMIVVPVAVIVGFAALVHRYGRVPTPTEQLQTKWVVYGLGLSFGLLIVASLLSLRVDGDGRRSSAATLLFVVEPIALLALPLSFAVALLRFRLWDVDVVISRTLLYAAMTGVVLLICGAVIGGASVLLGLQQSVFTAIFATGLIAVLIQPIQRRLQMVINRLAFGARDDHVQVLQLMGRQLESAATPEVALTAMTQTVAQSLKLSYAALNQDTSDPDNAEPGMGAQSLLNGEAPRANWRAFRSTSNRLSWVALRTKAVSPRVSAIWTHWRSRLGLRPSSCSSERTERSLALARGLSGCYSPSPVCSSTACRRAISSSRARRSAG